MGNIYIGQNNIARKVNKIYVGVNGIARQVQKVYVGDSNGIAREVYSAFDPFIASGTATLVDYNRPTIYTVPLARVNEARANGYKGVRLRLTSVNPSSSSLYWLHIYYVETWGDNKVVGDGNKSIPYTYNRLLDTRQMQYKLENEGTSGYVYIGWRLEFYK